MNINILTNLKLKYLVSFALLTGFFSFVLPINVVAENISPQIRWSVVDNQSVIDNMYVSLSAYDGSSKEIPVALSLMDRNCDVQIDNLYNSSLPSDLYSKEIVNIDTTNYSNGNYCLRYCAAIDSENISRQSKCISSNIIISNNSSELRFSDLPSSTLLVDSSDWEFDIDLATNTTDVYFNVVIGKDIVQIDRYTGKITLSSENIEPGSYPIIISAENSKSEIFQKQIYLDIPSEITVADGPSVLGTGTENNPTFISIFAPVEGDVLSQNTNLVFATTDDDGVNFVNLVYSSDGVNWSPIKFYEQSEIGTNVSTFEAEYEWDVSSIVDGQYWLKVIVVDNSGNVTERLSPQFVINNTGTGEDDDSPMIINIQPIDGDEITDQTPEISGQMVPSFGSSIDISTFSFSIDGEVSTQVCNVTESRFICNLSESLSNGIHMVSVSVSDTSGKQVSEDWTFTVNFNGQDDDSTDEEIDEEIEEVAINILGISIPRGIVLLTCLLCLCLILLIVLPWLLYILWLKKNDDDVNTKSSSSTNTSKQSSPTWEPDKPKSVYPMPIASTTNTQQNTNNNTPVNDKQNQFAPVVTPPPPVTLVAQDDSKNSNQVKNTGQESPSSASKNTSQNSTEKTFDPKPLAQIPSNQEKTEAKPDVPATPQPIVQPMPTKQDLTSTIDSSTVSKDGMKNRTPDWLKEKMPEVSSPRQVDSNKPLGYATQKDD